MAPAREDAYADPAAAIRYDNWKMLFLEQRVQGTFKIRPYKEFPPRQKAATFSIDQVVEKMADASKAA